MQEKYDTNIRERWWALRVDKTQPEFIVLEWSHVRILSIVYYFVGESRRAEHDSRVRQAAVKQHVELDQFVQRWVSNNFASWCISCLIVKN